MVASWGRMVYSKPIYHQEFMVSGTPAWTIDFEGRPVRLKHLGISFQRGSTANLTSYVWIYITYPSFNITPGLDILRLQATGLDDYKDDIIQVSRDFCLDLPAGTTLLGYGAINSGVGLALVDVYYEYLGFQ